MKIKCKQKEYLHGKEEKNTAVSASTTSASENEEQNRKKIVN